MVDALREVHAVGLTHQDIKPENFRIHENIVKILDFGLASDLFNDKNEHKSRENYGHQGTLYTCSVDVLKGYNISRKDDLESLGYSFM